MERPTINFSLPFTKKEIICKEWLTGREYENTQEPFYQNYKTGQENRIDVKGLTHKMLESYIVSIDGKTENIVDTIIDLPFPDYDFIIQKINEIKKKELI